jgi:hypothetical protein
MGVVDMGFIVTKAAGDEKERLLRRHLMSANQGIALEADARYNPFMTTVTIQVEDELFARARELAEARRITVSEMLERLLRVVAAPPLDRDDLPPLTRRVLGMSPRMTDEEVTDTIAAERMRKLGS